MITFENNRQVMRKIREHLDELCKDFNEKFRKEIEEAASFNEENRKKIEELKKELTEKKEAVLEEVDWNEFLKDIREAKGELEVVKTSTGSVIFNNKIFHYYPDKTGNSWDTFLFMECEKDTRIILPRYLKDGTAYQNLSSLFMDAVLPKGVRFSCEDMYNVKNIDNMFNGVKYESYIGLSGWHDLNVKAVDEQTNQFIHKTFTEITEDDIVISPETEEWSKNDTTIDPPTSYYTDALTALRNGAKKLKESYEKETGRVFVPGNDYIDFNYGLSTILNIFPDFEIVEPVYGGGYVVYSKKLYRFCRSYKLKEDDYFEQIDEDKECPIKPFNLETDEEYRDTLYDWEDTDE